MNTINFFARVCALCSCCVVHIPSHIMKQRHEPRVRRRVQCAAPCRLPAQHCNSGFHTPDRRQAGGELYRDLRRH